MKIVLDAVFYVFQMKKESLFSAVNEKEQQAMVSKNELFDIPQISAYNDRYRRGLSHANFTRGESPWQSEKWCLRA